MTVYRTARVNMHGRKQGDQVADYGGDDDGLCLQPGISTSLLRDKYIERREQHQSVSSCKRASLSAWKSLLSGK
ncbi:hypothetical protein LIA77_09995 [Sarocladium implicatum]|nr:hypothetical protein LIA77_09995 [Sarocladium implicatum]